MRPLAYANALSLLLVVAGAALLLVALHALERRASRYVAHRLGWRGVLVTAWLGVPCHELGHLAMARLFGHRIVAWRLFDPDPTSGTLGYVRHAYSRRSLWQRLGNLAIGLAPLLSGTLVLGALLALLVPPRELYALLGRAQHAAGTTLGASALLDSARVFGGGLAELLWQHRSPWLLLAAYLAVCVVAHLAPSKSDLAQALPPAAVVAALALGAALLLGQAGVAITALPALLVPLVALLTACTLFQALYLLVVKVATRSSA
ncbi:MAG: hypothetical protein KC503_36560 [Myxococcales bacterium]|nr:hypothetical protein [Myxococcales bacterium]